MAKKSYGVKLIGYQGMDPALPMNHWVYEGREPRTFDDYYAAYDFAREFSIQNPKGKYRVEEIPLPGLTTIDGIIVKALPNVKIVSPSPTFGMPLKLSDKLFDLGEVAHAISGENMQDQGSMVDQLRTWWSSRGQPDTVHVAIIRNEYLAFRSGTE
jgi:hypothetical protein